MEKNIEQNSIKLIENGIMKWQPIETIPEDYFVFVWIKSKHCKEYGRRVEICKAKNHRFGWSGLDEFDYRYLENGDIFFTHWMPLPNPPVINN